MEREPDASRPRVVIVGAGAAGTMAAIFAASGGADTLLLERTKDGGRKILISGGGRCNVLPSRLDERRFLTDSSANTMRRILRSWPLAEQRAFFEREVGVPLVDEIEDLKVFPASHKARDVRDGLLALARARGARVQTDAHVLDVRPLGAALNAPAGAASSTPATSPRWEIQLTDAPPILADAVILACGGLSVPTTGSDGAGLRIARQLGHQVEEAYPALTPLLASPSPFTALSGVSLTVTITARSATRSATATGGFLFTHRGYSGPAVLDVSHVVVRAQAEGVAAHVTVQWTTLDAAAWERALRPQGTRTVLGALRAELPDRLAAVLIERAQVDPARSLAELRREERVRLIETLVHGSLPWTGDEGYKKAEVTGGGVNLAAIDARTMESRSHPGLYLCGEMLDAFGPIGGYNFYWAWSTGRAAGLSSAAAAAKSRKAPSQA